MILIIMAKLKSENASAAIIIDKKNNFLLQKRDNKKNIFFPNHIGLFGGAKNYNESYVQALKRELKEEIGFTPQNINFFMKLSFNFKNKKILRYVYVCKMNILNKQKIKLNEGAGFTILSFFKIKSQLNNKNLFVPYDQMALWLYINKNRII
jgi:mutator protein MutT